MNKPRQFRTYEAGSIYVRYGSILRQPPKRSFKDQICHYGMLVVWMTLLTVLFASQRSLWITHAADPADLGNHVAAVALPK